MKKIVFYCLTLSTLGCDQHSGIFESMASSQTGISFVNEVKNTADFNIFNYRNFYNGGGVATGDLNNDGFPEVFFTSNMGENKLFLNTGKDFEFIDISKKAGIAEKGKWNTGVVMVDINQDGWLDIYVCNAGIDKHINGIGNVLFINNHDLTFTEKAAEYGLDDKGYSTHASFFDYDKDGDLDCYVLNNSFIPVNTLNYDNNRGKRAEDWPVKDFLKGGGDHFYKNNNGKFEDVSKQAGIYGSLIGFGLGVTVGDINNDTYPDIYISNDFFEKDYLYINQKDGTFKDEIESRIAHISSASMGADMADINNDGFQEIYVTDMLPRTEERLKTTTSFDNHYVYDLKFKKGFYRQYMQNVMQLNNQDGTYSEIANFANVAASDWSWGALLFDADNDRLTDIYVSNGIFHDVIDQDFIDFFANEVTQKMVLSGEKEKFDNILKEMPSRPQINNFFHNKGHMRFEDASLTFGFTEPSFSNGSAYADLDDDGDLDLIVNNVNQACFVFRNNTSKDSKHNFLKIKLKGRAPNTFAIGASIYLYLKNGEKLVRQIHPAKGFQSSVEYIQTLGLGDLASVDSIKVVWPDNRLTILKNVKANQTLLLEIEKANGVYNPEVLPNLKPLLKEQSLGDLVAHAENEDYVDFYAEKNIISKLSTEGPKGVVGDVNGDGLEDLFVCGAKGQAGQLYVQQSRILKLKPQKVFEDTRSFEDTAAEFFDADGDRDLDLFVGTGGNEESIESHRYLSRLYINDGKGNFNGDPDMLPYLGTNVSVVVPLDFDQDGDKDLFVGSRSTPLTYGLIPESFFLKNNGKGYFTNMKLGKELTHLGMIRNAVSLDKNQLIVVGDWMPPKLIRFKNGIPEVAKTGLENYHGFWGAVKSVDIDFDGDKDLILGNMGENTSLKAKSDTPLKLWVGDLDNNKIVDKVITKTHVGQDVPVFLKRDMMDQFPFLKAQSIKHKDYAKKNIEDLFKSDMLKKAQITQVNYLFSALAINNGKNIFTIKKLPEQVDISCINAIAMEDVNKDGVKDVLLGGNFYGFIPQFTRLDACRGITLLNDKNGLLRYLPNSQSGFTTQGEVKDILTMKIGGKSCLVVLSNNRAPKFFAQN